MLGCLDTPTKVEYFLDGISVRSMSRNQRARLRNSKIGFIFQNYNLLPKTTAVENVELPLLYNSEVTAKDRIERATRALEHVGLANRLYHKSNQMSGGQQQRVAIARAMITKPSVILADEPTGNLDSASGKEILSLLKSTIKKYDQTLILITHDSSVAAEADRILTIKDGKLV